MVTRLRGTVVVVQTARDEELCRGDYNFRPAGEHGLGSEKAWELETTCQEETPADYDDEQLRLGRLLLRRFFEIVPIGDRRCFEFRSEIHHYE